MYFFAFYARVSYISSYLNYILYVYTVKEEIIETPRIYALSFPAVLLTICSIY